MSERTVGPGLMDGSLLVELLSQVLQPLQTSDLAEDPLLVAFLCPLQGVPGPVDVLMAKQLLAIQTLHSVNEQMINNTFTIHVSFSN